MGGTNLSTLDSILKTQYLGPIREQIPTKMILFNRLKRNSDSVQGKNFTIPLHIGRNVGTGAAAEGAALVKAGHQKYAESIVPMRYNYGHIELTGPTIKAARNDAGAFVRAVESEIKGMTKDIRREINRQLWADGSGLLTKCGVTSNATTVVVDSTKYLDVDMVIDILVMADGTESTGASERAITEVVDDTHIKIDGAAVTTDATFGIYRNGAKDMEMMGFAGIFSASTKLQNLDPATAKYWKAQILANDGTLRAISETILQTAVDNVEQYSEGEPTALYSNYGVRRAYVALQKTMNQFVNTKEYKGGFDYIDYNNLKWFVDKDCPANSIYIPDESELEIYQLADFDWMDEDGAVLSRVSGKDAYEAIIYYYSELGCSMRNAMCKVGDITEA